MSELDIMVDIVRELYPEEDTAGIEDLQYYIEEQFDIKFPLDDLKPYITETLIEEEDLRLQFKHLGL